MKSHTQVVVIGGGISGCSTLYHLTQEGWNDVMLVERDDLTSGTTWHSAAQVPNLAPNQLLMAMRSYTIGLYKELASDPDYPINYHHGVGGVRLITDQNQLDACYHVISAAKGVGVDLQLISPEEVLERNPLLHTQDILAGLWDAEDGDIDPAQLCQALARRSRKAGAEIVRHNPVIGLTQKPDSQWIVHTEKGDIHCQYVVNACGYRVNEVGKMMGVEYPVVSMEHMYCITDDIAELKDHKQRVAMVRCPRDTFYMRQEKQGLLIGVYEMECKTWGMEGIDPNFSNSLCVNDLERCLPKLEAIIERVPCLQQVGIKSIINGPIAYSADASPLIGKTPGVRNAYSINGIRVGIGEGGGYGKMLAQMIVHGETELETWPFDPRRIVGYANQNYTALKAIEDYQNEFRWHRPHEHRPAGRPCKTTSIYPLLKRANAEFGVINGWERAMFYKPNADFEESHHYHLPNWHEVVGKEVHAVTQNIGLLELCGFNRIEIKGEGAVAWLDTLICGQMPKGIGKVRLGYILTEKGNVLGEATLAMLSEDTVWWGSAATAEHHDYEWLSERIPADSDITITSLTNSHTTLVVAGPKSRLLLERLSPRTDWSRNGFAPLTVQPCFIEHFEATAISISYSGELAWELHFKNAQLLGAYQALVSHGEDFHLAHFGMYAVDAMRLEKGYGHWKSDFITEFNPIEAQLQRFVDFDKEFPGKHGLINQLENGIRKIRVMMIIEGSIPAQPEDSIIVEGKVVGGVTSAGWGYRVKQNLAMGYVLPDYADQNIKVSILIQNNLVTARVCEICLYDPEQINWRIN